MAEMVTIRHKDHDKSNTTVASFEAFKALWESRGYLVVDPDTGEKVSEAASAAATAQPDSEEPTETVPVDPTATPSSRKRG